MWSLPPDQLGTSLVAQRVKHLPTMWETRVQSLGREDLLEKEVAMHSSTLAWKNPMGGGAWWAIVHGVKQSDTTERLHFHFPDQCYEPPSIVLAFYQI